jgi:transcriptional regulator with XRE-family HTH domain
MSAMPGSESPFSRLVRGRMEERGLGLRELCRAVGLDPSFFSKVLADKRSPPHEEEILRGIARELELDPLRLITAAGRIPSEWGRLRTDPALFETVHRVVTRGAGAWAAEAAPAGGALRMPEELGEELL